MTTKIGIHSHKIRSTHGLQCHPSTSKHGLQCLSMASVNFAKINQIVQAKWSQLSICFFFTVPMYEVAALQAHALTHLGGDRVSLCRRRTRVQVLCVPLFFARSFPFQNTTSQSAIAIRLLHLIVLEHRFLYSSVARSCSNLHPSHLFAITQDDTSAHPTLESRPWTKLFEQSIIVNNRLDFGSSVADILNLVSPRKSSLLSIHHTTLSASSRNHPMKPPFTSNAPFHVPSVQLTSSFLQTAGKGAAHRKFPNMSDLVSQMALFFNSITQYFVPQS